jgi:DNA topoisomerase-2
MDTTTVCKPGSIVGQDPAADINRAFPYFTAEKSVRSKDWAAGTCKQIPCADYLFDASYAAAWKEYMVSPACEKCVDEVVVNATDHCVRDPAVTYVSVTFAHDGTITITNDGRGIPSDIHPEASRDKGREIRVPELIFGELFQGSNGEKNLESIIGGENGLGAKIANLHAILFYVASMRNGTLLEQTWRNHMQQVSPPILTKSNVSRTTVSFLLDYCGDFFYTPASLKKEMPVLESIARTRAVYASVYVHAINGAKVFFNDAEIKIKTVEHLARAIYPGATVIKTTLQATDKYAWPVCAVIRNDKRPMKNITITNGIVTRAGRHVDFFYKKLVDSVLVSLAAVFDNSKDVSLDRRAITDNLCLVMCTMVPGAGWEGQRKDTLVVDTRMFAKRDFTQSFKNAVATAAKEKIIVASIPEKAATGRKSAFKHDKYVAASLCNTSRALECILISGEGDSAVNHLKTGIGATVGFEKIGLFPLRGVIMNARKKITKVGDSIIRSNKLIENEEINNIIAALGLNIRYKYDPASPTYKKEMGELHYGAYCMCVDQDLDGKGNILGLMVSLFEVFWPNLLRAGYLKWMTTPIIRLFPRAGRQVIEFMSIAEHKRWTEAHPTANYEIKYYKGIGTHSPKEITHICKNIKIVTFAVDGGAHQSLETYFGKDPEQRKVVLSKMPETMPDEMALSIIQTGLITCTQHALYEVDPYQRDNLARKLDHVIDGQNQCGRLIVNHLVTHMNDKEHRVTTLTGAIMKSQDYTHGDASLAQTIVGKAFVSCGGKQLPLLIPVGNFGTRLKGGADASPARYIYTQFNCKLLRLLFNAEDYYNLTFVKNGDAMVPEHFVPIVPLVILESAHLPAHGWKLQSWARDIFAVIDATKTAIATGRMPPPGSLPVCLYGPHQRFKGRIINIRGTPHSFGEYILQGTDATGVVIKITELPLGVWVSSYLTSEKSPFVLDPGQVIHDYQDHSSEKGVDITVWLVPGALARLETLGTDQIDGIEEYFRLRKSMKPHLNFMYQDSVVSHSCYEAFFAKWYYVRVEYYEKRILRQLEIVKAKQIWIRNVIRYVDEYVSLGLPGKTEAQMNAALADAGYDKIKKSALEPKHVPICDIVGLAMQGNYNYLLKMSSLDKTVAAMEKYKQKRAELDEQYAAYTAELTKPVPGAAFWLKELDELAAVVRAGFEVSWQFEEQKYDL